MRLSANIERVEERTHNMWPRFADTYAAVGSGHQQTSDSLAAQRGLPAKGAPPS